MPTPRLIGMTNRSIDSPKALAGPASVSTIALGAAMLGALGLVVFAAVNIAFEATDHFAGGPLAAYASGLAFMNWLVVGLKLFGAVVLVLSVLPRTAARASNTMTLLLWGAFGAFAIYALGTIGEAAALATGITGSPDEIDAAGVVYLLGAVFFATSFGVVAISHARRTRWRPVPIVAGLLGAPVLLAGILVLAPMLLVAVGVMPPF